MYISLRLDGELSDFEQALLGSHLEGCSACRAFAADIGEITTDLRAAPAERLERPLVLPQRVHVAFRRVQLGAAAAVLVTVVGVAGLLGSVGSSEQRRFVTPTDLQPTTPTLRELRAQELKPLAVPSGPGKILFA
jgi:predicted anti-sigma-YlaC factor YlaD